jgi:integrase
MEKLPRALPWKTVQHFLRSIPKSTPLGRRDYTIFFIIAAYGLRVSEVAALTLDDLNWKAREIRIRQTKTRSTLNLPLTDEVARVLIEYLRCAPRPKGYRSLFFKMNAPIRAIERTAIAMAFRKRFRNSGLHPLIGAGGPHTLRHSYALHLLQQRTSLKTIGDLLGHKNAASTAGYLRLATNDLRKVGLPIPGEEGKHEN